MALTPSPRTSFPATATTEAMTLRHRGFDLTIATMHGRFGAQSYGYTVLHLGHVLHESRGDFGTASAADKMARQLIDDALGMFDRSLACLEEDEA
ncbi:MAG: hypothetical protein IIC18_00460 [Bacteroidetes bacterium]|nr:hypothetical protein [Bacteroidota bacterium]